MMITDYADCSYSQMTEHHQDEQIVSWSIAVRKSRQPVTSPFKDSVFVVTSPAGGLATLNSHPNIAKNPRALKAKGFMKLVLKIRLIP